MSSAHYFCLSCSMLFHLSSQDHPDGFQAESLQCKQLPFPVEALTPDIKKPKTMMGETSQAGGHFSLKWVSG